jgi:uncharacterized OsmC-like protein
MIKKTNSNYCFLSCFSAQETFAQSKKKRKQIETAKVETKGADEKKEPKPYKKLLIQLQLRKED